MIEGPRGVLAHEIDAVVALADEVFAPGMGPSFPTMFRAENGPWLRTMWDDGRPVSLVGVWRGEVASFGRRFSVAHVGAVGTTASHRGRGLAGHLLADTLLRLHAEGTALLFISGDRSLYVRAGARGFGRVWHCEAAAEAGDGSGADARGALAGRPAGSGDDVVALPEAPDDALLAEMAALYEAEPVRHVRSPLDWRLLMPGKGYVPPTRGRGVVVVRHGGRLAAYMLWGSPWREAPGERRPLPVDEFAGDRRAAWQAIQAALRVTERPSARFPIATWDAAMRAVAVERGARLTEGGHIGTARILHAGAFWRVLADTAGPGPDPRGVAERFPTWPLGTPEEADQAAVLTLAALGPDAAPEPLPVPRMDGPNFI